MRFIPEIGDMLRGRSGYTHFEDIEVGHCFFLDFSNVPFRKVNGGNYVEEGTTIEYPLAADTKVVPIELVRDSKGKPVAIKLGHYTISFSAEKPDAPVARQRKKNASSNGGS